jgi:hypothetical protein
VDDNPTSTANQPNQVTPQKSPRQQQQKRPALPGFATYMPDWNKMRLLQKALDVGVDNHRLRKIHGDTCDSFKLVSAWNIQNPQRQQKYQAALQRERTNCARHECEPHRIPSDFTSVIQELGQEQLDQSANEVYLLHGTDPRNLHGILFEGLDPEVAGNGLFGRGTYFAECSAKIDQYASKDEKYNGEESLKELHSKLYKNGARHPQQVYYCLVARVILGRPIRTKDGEYQLDGDGNRSDQELFTDDRRSKLSPFTDGTTPSSLIAERGELRSSFREFVVMNSDQIFVEYVIAYQRRRKYCDCGLETVERTVTKEGSNRGRKIFMCSKDSHDKTRCSFLQMDPPCFCGKSAYVRTSHSASNPGRKYFTCCHNREHGGRAKCDFFAWLDGPNQSAYTPKKLRFD